MKEKTKKGVLSSDRTENPKLKYRVLKNGKLSLYLDYYRGYTSKTDEQGNTKIKHQTREEALKLTLYSNPRTPEERTHNKNTLELAKKIRFEREQEFLQDKQGYRLKAESKENFFDYFQTYIDEWRTEKQPRMLKGALQWFTDFIQASTKYKHLCKGIEPQQLTRELMEDFAKYIQERGNGEGGKSIWQRFKKVINYALAHDVITKNPCTGITITATDINTKAFLTTEELQKLSITHYKDESPIIRRAFLFSCMTGLRFCDVRKITFELVDIDNRALIFEQEKTKGHSHHSKVKMPLNETAFKIVMQQAKDAKSPTSAIFPLPSSTACLKALKRWTARAGIKKHITWHCGRVTFGTTLCANGADMATTKELLGHSNMAYLTRYVMAVEENKRKAIDSLPTLNV